MPSLLDKLLGRPSHPRPAQFAGHLYPAEAEVLGARIDRDVAAAAPLVEALEHKTGRGGHLDAKRPETP